jgi:uncharacterized protein with NRDE domain
VPLALERALSSPFVRMPEQAYGTRSSTLLRIEHDGARLTAQMDEWQHDTARPDPLLDPARHRRVRMDLLRAP